MEGHTKHVREPEASYWEKLNHLHPRHEPNLTPSSGLYCTLIITGIKDTPPLRL